MSGDMDTSGVKDALGEQYDDFEEHLIDVGYLAVPAIYDLDTLVDFARTTLRFFDEEEDEEYDWSSFYEFVFSLAGAMLLAAKAQGWGGEELTALYDEFELND